MAFFLSEDLRTKLSQKWLLWDACAVNRIVECGEEAAVFEELESAGIAENVTIKPVILETSATKDIKLAAKRLQCIDENISLIKSNLDQRHDATTNIQAAMPKESQPGAVDLILGSTLAQYSRSGSGNMLLITENIKDFAEPVYNKIGMITVTNDFHTYSLTILKMDKSKI